MSCNATRSGMRQHAYFDFDTTHDFRRRPNGNGQNPRTAQPWALKSNAPGYFSHMLQEHVAAMQEDLMSYYTIRSVRRLLYHRYLMILLVRHWKDYLARSLRQLSLW